MTEQVGRHEASWVAPPPWVREPEAVAPPRPWPRATTPPPGCSRTAMLVLGGLIAATISALAIVIAYS